MTSIVELNEVGGLKLERDLEKLPISIINSNDISLSIEILFKSLNYLFLFQNSVLSLVNKGDGSAHHHSLITAVKTSTNNSDGSDIVSVPLNSDFKHGLFVAMSDDKTFHLYRWEDIAGSLLKKNP